MLEAIIAFMPVNEDHDAIGALKFSSESRKKLAIASVKFKCDICGPICNLLPIIRQKDNKVSENINNKGEVNLLENMLTSSENIDDNNNIIL